SVGDGDGLPQPDPLGRRAREGIDVRGHRRAAVDGGGAGLRAWGSAGLRRAHPGLTPDLRRRRMVALRPSHQAWRSVDPASLVSRLQGDRYEVRGPHAVLPWRYAPLQPARYARMQGALDVDSLPGEGSGTPRKLEPIEQDASLEQGAATRRRART